MHPPLLSFARYIAAKEELALQSKYQDEMKHTPQWRLRSLYFHSMEMFY